MKEKLSAPWAQTPAANRREPTGSEIATGFPCGPADQQLFNELMFRLSQLNAEVSNAVSLSGQTPAEADLEQLWKAMKRLASNARGGRSIYPAAGTYTFTVPADIHFIAARIWAGGGGGGGSASTSGGASGGGGGEYREGVFPVTPGQNVTVTVGAGGAGGVGGAAPTNGNTGGTSSVGPLVSALGGLGGTAQPGSGSTATSGDGGSGGLGGIGIAGRPGQLAFVTGTGAYAGGVGGGAFCTSNGGPSVGGAGNPGVFPAGGGNGSAANAAGGVGSGGLVILEY